ncbi:MAG: cytochrome c biogenesis protein [Actinomycetota bacterium]|nr:cytochrome c biogenesis protein [Actinomycetota bacterium]
MTVRRFWPELLAAAALAVGLAVGLSAPPDARLQGYLQKIMYVHVPAAWSALYLAFAITVLASIVWLVRRRPRWDHLAASSAEVGVFFTALTLATGMIWAKPVWGVWWTWDARLTTTALLFFVYLGYLALRRAISDPEVRARRSAILGIIAFVQVPIIHFSVVWWRTLHQPPTVLRPDQPAMDPTLLVALLVNVAAFTVLYLALVRRRLQLAQLEGELERRLVSADRPLAGTAVTTPRLERVDHV